MSEVSSPNDNAPEPVAPAAKDAPKNKRRARTIGMTVGGAATLAGLLWIGHWLVVGRFIESTDDAYLKADSVVVAPKVAGYVAEVYVQSNQAVKQGDPLVRLDSRQYQAVLDQAQAAIEARQADMASAEAALDQEQAQIQQSEAQAQVARVAAKHAREEYERYVPLDASGAASTEKLAELRNARDQADATLNANLAALKAARSHFAASAAQLDQAKAQLKAGEASKRQNTLDVEDAIVRSAIDGRVGDDSVRVGQYAQPGTRMMSIVPVQQVYLIANFKETQIGRMRIGQAVTLHVDALPDVDLHGTVESFSPGTGSQFALLPPENATGNFTKIVQRVPVRVRIDASPELRERLLPGLSVTAEVDTRSEGKESPRG